MSPPYLVPPSSPEVGDTAPLGTYIPSIDPNVLWDDDGSIWLFFSRNAYRNWVWSDEFERYIEESNIYAVRLDDKWWHDPDAKTLPAVHESYRDVYKDQPEGWVDSVNDTYPGPTRKDGFVPVISYKLQPQVSTEHNYQLLGCNRSVRPGRTPTSMTIKQATAHSRTVAGQKDQPQLNDTTVSDSLSTF